MSKGTIICLCDITGVMSVPWVEAGYRAVLVDPQHPDTSINGPIERISATIMQDDRLGGRMLVGIRKPG